MFRATSAHLQEDIVVYMQYMVPSLSTECPRRNVPNFGRVFLMLNYTDITQNTYIPKLNGYGDNGQRSLKL